MNLYRLEAETERLGADSGRQKGGKDLAGGNNKRLTFKNGVYEGSVNTNGMPEGRGRFTLHSGSFVYEGEWLNGEIHGKGKGEFYKKDKNGALVLDLTFEGEWNHGEMVHDGGLFKWKNVSRGSDFEYQGLNGRVVGDTIEGEGDKITEGGRLLIEIYPDGTYSDY